MWMATIGNWYCCKPSCNLKPINPIDSGHVQTFHKFSVPLTIIRVREIANGFAQEFHPALLTRLFSYSHLIPFKWWCAKMSWEKTRVNQVHLKNVKHNPETANFRSLWTYLCIYPRNTSEWILEISLKKRAIVLSLDPTFTCQVQTLGIQNWIQTGDMRFKLQMTSKKCPTYLKYS